MPIQPVTFQVFNGGIADRYIGTDIRHAARMDNLLIDETDKPYGRFGTFIFDARPLVPTTDTVPTGIYLGSDPFSRPFQVMGSHIYQINEENTWEEVVGPMFSFLPLKTNNRENALFWRRQMIAVAEGTRPVMIYSPYFGIHTGNDYVRDFANPAEYNALTLGMPALASKPSVDYDPAESYQVVYAFFYKYTFVDYTGTLFTFFGNPNIPSFVNGSSTDQPNIASIGITNIPELSNTLPVGELNNYDVSSRATTNSNFTQGSDLVGVASSIGIEVGAQVLSPNVPLSTYVTQIIGSTAIRVSGKATQTSGAVSTTYSTLTIQIYRTVNGGSVLFYLDQLANATTSYTDQTADSVILTNPAIYISGNAVGYDLPPQQAFAVTQTNDFFWYATPNALYQSIQGAPGACPSSFLVETDQVVRGLSDIIAYPVLFCDRSIYRVEGTFDSFGNGGFALREISQTAGCAANSSIVKTPYGLFFFGNGGIFHTNGYDVKKISRHLDDSYKLWANANVTGQYDPTYNKIYWTINTDNNSPGQNNFRYFFEPNYNNAFLVLHLSYGVMEESVFTTGSSKNNLYPTALKFSDSQDIYLRNTPSTQQPGTYTSGTDTIVVFSALNIGEEYTVTGPGIPYGSYVTNISGTTITINQNVNETKIGQIIDFYYPIYQKYYSRMLFTDRNGYLLWFDPNSYTDVLIDTNLFPQEMGKKAIIYNFTTAGLDQGTPGFRKYTADMSLEVDGITSIAMQIRHRSDEKSGWSGEGGSPPAGKGVAGSPGGGSSGYPGVPEVRQDTGILWDITDCLWLDDETEHPWDEVPTLTDKRTIPATKLRSTRRQLQFTNAYTIIVSSDDYALASTVPYTPGVLPTVILASGAWPDDVEDYYLTFSGDGYNQTYYITRRIDDLTLEVTDPYSTLIAASNLKWEIKGYRKFERPRILSFTLYADIDGVTQAPSTSPQGANS